jgi:hypothetical protein
MKLSIVTTLYKSSLYVEEFYKVIINITCNLYLLRYEKLNF